MLTTVYREGRVGVKSLSAAEPLYKREGYMALITLPDASTAFTVIRDCHGGATKGIDTSIDADAWFPATSVALAGR